MLKIAVILAVLILSVFAQNSNYSYDGTNNNLNNPTWGAISTPLLRACGPVYEDGASVPAGGAPTSRYPSPRLISNIIFGRVPAGLRPRNPRMVSDALTYWGQFIAHDTDFSPDTFSPSLANCEKFFIPIPPNDPYYVGYATMNFCRTVFINGTGTSAANPRQQPNKITAWIDGSAVYGSTAAWSQALRTGSGGLMKTQTGPDGDLLPLNNDGNGNPIVVSGMSNPSARVPGTAIFAAGDARANENPALASMHTLWVREHNRRAKLLPDSMTDEQKFQAARRVVIALIQHITFNEYLPTLIGTAVPAYPGYNASANPQIYTEFSTAAFRYGHDEISGILYRYDRNGLPDIYGNTIVRDNYFWPAAITNTTGIGAYLRGLSVNPQNALDAQIDEDMRTFLFSLPPGTATDLAARNIQRGRDHGICRYVEVRKAYGLSPCSDYSCITADPALQSLLAQAYGAGNVGNVDLFVGGLLEDRAPTTNLGPLFTAIITEQLYRIRSADRFWYENSGVLTSSELSEVKSTYLSDIIVRNTDTATIPQQIFVRSNVAPAVALGATGTTNNTPWIIAVVVLAIIAGILLIVVVGLCISKSSSSNTSKNDGQLYENLLESK